MPGKQVNDAEIGKKSIGEETFIKEEMHIGIADLTPNWEFGSSPTITGFPYSSGDLIE
jgi:hypothetical protein